MIFAELLKAELSKAGLSQKELAEKSGLTQATISRYLADLREPKWRDVQKLATALGVGCEAFKETVEESHPLSQGGSLSHPEPEASPKKKGKAATTRTGDMPKKRKK